MDERRQGLFNHPGEHRIYTPENNIPLVTPLVRWTRERWQGVGLTTRRGAMIGAIIGLLSFNYHLPSMIIGAFGGAVALGLLGSLMDRLGPRSPAGRQ